MRSRASSVLHVLVVAALAVGMLAATGTDGSVLLTDACADPVNERDVGLTPWTDLCALSVVASPGAGTDGATLLEVAVEVVSTERTTPTTLQVKWETEGCSHRLAFGDQSLDAPAYATAARDCGDGDGSLSTSDCMAQTGSPINLYLVCRGDYEIVDIAPPVVEDGRFVWRLDLAGEVGALLGAAGQGTVLDGFRAVLGNRLNGSAPAGVVFVCADKDEDETCYSTLVDRIGGPGTLTLP